MQVAELTAYHVRIPFRRAIRHASHSRSDTDNVLVRCVLDDHTEGFGEGVPREYVTGESIDFALDLLRRSDLRSQLDDVPGIGPRRRRALLTKFGSLAGVRRATREELEMVVGAKAAGAVIDYFAKSA